MGNSNSKSRKKNDPRLGFFGRMHREEAEKQKQVEILKRLSGEVNPNPNTPSRPPKIDPQPPTVPYDKEAIDRMRQQMRQNPGAFLLNNIMLSVQFLDNYERVLSYLKNDSITEADRDLNDNMAQHQKHVFLPDKLQEIIDANVYYFDRSSTTDSNEVIKSYAPRDTQPNRKMESLQHQRMYVIHDNIDVNQPGEVSDYSTITNAPHYNFEVESLDEPGYIKLKRLDTNKKVDNYNDSQRSIEPKKPDIIESGAESDISDISKDETEDNGENFMKDLMNRVNQPPKSAFKKNGYDENFNVTNKKLNFNEEIQTNTNERRPSGILKPTNSAVMKGALNANKNKVKKPRLQEVEEKKSVSESESSGYKSSHSPQTESEYGYATITAESSLKRLEMSQLLKTSDSTSEIPARCISTIEIKRLYSDEDDDTDEPYDTRYGAFQRELYKKLYYLNSRIFMLNFSDLFQLKLAQSLGFNEQSLVSAMTQGASIYCDIVDNKMANSYEVIPAIGLTWPPNAIEWLHRNRNLIKNPRTNFVYQWPTEDMVSKSKALGCFAVPLGFVPTRGTNPQQALQWKLTFPTVERYLETCMAHSQVRCYIFSLILFKKFMEIKGTNIGFRASHIKNHLFWQMEENYARWPEDRLGEALLIFLKSFYDSLMRSKLPYYFIPKCNLAKGIPKSVLLRQQKKLADILESPVMHLLSSLKNVKHVKTDFYPILNIKKLYRIITCEDALRLINPSLPRDIGGAGSEEEEIENPFKRNNDDGFWQKRKKNPEYYWKKEHQRHREAVKVAQAIVATQSTPKEMIDLKRKIPPFDIHRKRLILEMFIPHFIEISDCSVKFESLRQALLYLEHARRLSMLLKEEPSCEGQAREYVAVINEKIENLKTTMVKPSAPKLPTRNEGANNLPGPSGIRKSSEYVNINGNSQKDHIGNYRHGSESPTTKMANVVFADVNIENDKPKAIRCISFQKVEEEDEDSDEVEESQL